MVIFHSYVTLPEGMCVYIYGHPLPYDPPMCHLYYYLQHKMRIFSIPFLSSSYIVITIQYLKALWGRPHRNTIDRRPKIKKTSGKQKKKNKKNTKKKTIFSDSSGVTP